MRWVYACLGRGAVISVTIARDHPLDTSARRAYADAALLIALIQTPHRFRTKRQLWAYSGLAVETHDSAEYRLRDGQLEGTRKQLQVRGLNSNRNPHLKQLFKATALSASIQPGPFGEFYGVLLKKGIKAPMARLTLARKIAAIVLTVWKKGESFEPTKLNPQAA